MKKNSFKDYCAVALISLFATYAIYEKFMLPELIIPTIVSVIYLVIFIACFKLKEKVTEAKIYDKISCALFAVFMIVGDSFKEYDSLFGIIGNPFKGTDTAVLLFEDLAGAFGFLNGTVGNVLMVFSSICAGIGYYFIFKYLLVWLKSLYFSINNKKIENKLYNKWTSKIFDEHTFRKIFLILIIAWLPYYIAKFPGLCSDDAHTQIRQFSGELQLTTINPILSTVLIGGFGKIGLLLGNLNIGIFLFVLVQYIATAAIFAYCVTTVSRFKISKLYCWGMILIYAVSPMFPNFATTVVKDTFFCTLFTLFILFLTLIIRSFKNGTVIKSDIIKFSILAFFVSMMRNNGIYLIVPTIILLAFAILYIKEKAVNKIKLICIIVLPLIAFSVSNFIQYDVLNIEKGSIKEALSIPFQQTARYVRDHPEDVTEEEREIINKVLDYDNLAELYVPVCSDEVKATYKEDSSALGDYFKVWFKHFTKHPVTYIEATLNTAYPSFYPDKMNTRSYGSSSKLVEQPGGIFSLARTAMLALSMGFSLIPGISIIVNPVFYIWLLFYLAIRALFKKHFMNLIILVPMLVQFLVVVAGPAVFNHPRYMYPIAWAILIPFAYMLSDKKSDEKNEKKINKKS